MKTLLLNIFLLTLLTFAYSKLIITEPQSLIADLDGLEKNNSIPYYQLAHDVEQGGDKRFMGTLYYDPQNPHGCESTPIGSGDDDEAEGGDANGNSSSNEGKSGGDNDDFEGDDEENLQNVVVIYKEGVCSIRQKIHHAHEQGAMMVIIVSTKSDLKSHHHRRRVHGGPINAVMISNKIGDKLINYIEKTKSFLNYPEIFFSEDKDSTQPQKIDIDFWFSSSDEPRDTLHFLQQFERVYKIIGHAVINFTPRIVTWPCAECRDTNFNEQNSDCLSGGRYCDPDPENQDRKGYTTVIEDLRLKCIFQQDDVLFFKYFKIYLEGISNSMVDSKSMLGENEHMDLVIDSLSQAGITGKSATKLEECMRDSFQGSHSSKSLDQIQDDNKILQEDSTLKEALGVSYYPVLFVDKQQFEGSFYNLVEMQEFICSRLSVNQFCETLISKLNDEDDIEGLIALILVIILVVSSMCLIVTWVRKNTRTQVMGEIKHEITDVVAQYKLFKDRTSNQQDTALEMQ